MISYLQGTVLRKEGDAVVLLVGGVGYRLRLPVDVLCDLADSRDAALHVHTHVREDALELFGFSTLPQLHLFERLLSIQKIGPRLALALLSSIPASALVAAIREGDATRLSRAPGVGKKTAERIILELRDKLDDLAGAGDPAAGPVGPGTEDLVSALVNLGYGRKQAESAAARASREEGQDAELEVVLRTALRQLAG